ADRQWWFNFVYRINKERGQDFIEDLWAPGFFKHKIIPGNPRGETPAKIVLWATLSPPWSGSKKKEMAELNIDTVCKNLLRHQENIKYKAITNGFAA
ncbi:MAG: hypothetical protein GTN53_40925, partial [Candidatus Aminicenantes bacterium]|nr:hypothetical protein [Candidatus Aenigmarchaeota archaeon]NIO87019.1 hypothetical protein [Candidatus Aminicenantes bacterium]NIQ72858.1 hypothetical protein [Candidatus Aminicenantes bacterium]NIT28881.1 hypothetical protein [Candidatus Aminicenantes bacterium]